VGASHDPLDPFLEATTARQSIPIQCRDLVLCQNWDGSFERAELRELPFDWGPGRKLPAPLFEESDSRTHLQRQYKLA
jgi:hypothetical protein